MMKKQTRNYLVLLLLFAALIVIVFGYSNISSEKPKSTKLDEQQASKISKDISEDLGSVKSVLDDIEKRLE